MPQTFCCPEGHRWQVEGVEHETLGQVLCPSCSKLGSPDGPPPPTLSAPPTLPPESAPGQPVEPTLTLPAEGHPPVSSPVSTAARPAVEPTLDLPARPPTVNREDGTLHLPGTKVPAVPEPPATEQLTNVSEGNRGRVLEPTLIAPPTLPPDTSVREEDDATQGLPTTEEAPPTRHGLPNFSEAPTRPAPTSHARATPKQIGNYEILGELGRGGMGVVYRARDSRLHRIVALKMIRAGVGASAADIRRFRTEAEAVARLQHPNIVQIYEIGEHAGLPYFSLEFIDGGSLQDLMAQKTRVPARRAAALIETLARAMHYAHERGVVHRDLKPGNVLMTRPDSAEARAVRSAVPASVADREFQDFPKITDFGLAKQRDRDAGHTQEGSILGTPSYMAPEQAEGRTREIGPPADVYALGAILYDLLASRPPFRGETVMDTLQQVINADPLPPTQLQPGLSRDLETICLKCLQKDIRKRYASALELADDLRRWLDGEPIRARATPAWEKALKWIRRRPAVASLLGMGLLLAASLVAGSLWVAARERDTAQTEKGLRLEAEEQRQRADAQALAEAQARQKADEARAAEYQQRLRADRRYRDALRAVDALLTEISEERLRHEPKMQGVRRELLRKALDFYRRFQVEESSDPAVREETGYAWRRMGGVAEELELFDEAERCYVKALAGFRELLRDFPGHLGYARGAAIASQDLARARQARKDFVSALECFGQSLHLLEDAFWPAIHVARLGAACQPWAVLLAAPAEDHARRLMLIAEARLQQGILRQQQGQSALARADFEAALATLTRLRDSRPEEPLYRHKSAKAREGLAAALVREQPPRTFSLLGEAIADLSRLTQEYPRIATYRADLALLHGNRAALSFSRLRTQPKAIEDIEADLKKAIQLLAGLARDFEESPEYLRQLAHFQGLLGLCYRYPPVRNREGAAARQAAVEALRELDRRFPGRDEYRRELASAWNELGVMLQSTGVNRHDDAASAFDQCRALREQTLRGREQDPQTWKEWLVPHKNKALMYRAIAKNPEADQAYREWVAAQEKRLQRFPGEITYLGELVETRIAWREVLQARNRQDERQKQLLQAIAEQEQIVAKSGANPVMNRLLCLFYLEAGQYEPCEKALERWLKLVPAQRRSVDLPLAAGVLAACAASAAGSTDEAIQKKADGYAARAVQLLRQAQLRDARRLDAEEFAPLRQREDFQALRRALTSGGS